MTADDDADGGAGREPVLVDGVPTDEVVALLSVPPEEFVTTRAARVKELKAAGDRDLAVAVGKLRKPSRGMWVVGEVARRDPDLATAAVAAAEAAEAAMSGTVDGPADLRSTLEELRVVVGRAATAGAAVDRATDRPAVELALREILADPDARQAWAGGWLLDMPSGSAAPPDELAPRRARREAERSAAVKVTAAADRVTPARPEEVEETAAERRARQAEQAARLAARRKRERARRRAQEASSEADDLLSRAAAAYDDAAADLDDLEHRLAALEKEAVDARQRVSAAASDVEVAERKAAEARAAVAELEASEDDDHSL